VDKSTLTTLEVNLNSTARFEYCLLVSYRHFIQTNTTEHRGADKSLARSGRKQARKHVRDARDFNNIETQAAINFFLQGKTPKEIHAILKEALACFLPGRAKDLSAPLYIQDQMK